MSRDVCTCVFVVIKQLHWLCVRVCVCVCVCVCVFITPPSCVCVCGFVCVCTCVCGLVWWDVRVYSSAVGGVCVCVCECVHMCVCLCVWWLGRGCREGDIMLKCFSPYTVYSLSVHVCLCRFSIRANLLVSVYHLMDLNT